MKTFKQFFTEQTGGVALLPGGFKPPHKGHFEALRHLIKTSNATKAVVYIGNSPRDNITADQSQAIWSIYAKHVGVPVDIMIAPVTPVKSVYEYVDAHMNTPIAVGAGVEDQARYSFFKKHSDKYTMVQIVTIPPQFGRISGTATREKISSRSDDAMSFVPDEVRQSPHDLVTIREILGI